MRQFPDAGLLQSDGDAYEGRTHQKTDTEGVLPVTGFSDELFDRASAVNSDAQLYKQAGNAVTATVAYAVAMSLPESRN